MALEALGDEAMEALEGVRRAVLASPDLPIPRDERERAAAYDLRVAGPDLEPVPLDVEVVRGGLDAGGGATETASREVLLTPQIVAESPAGIRVFVAWNHVARTFVVWLTGPAVRALREGNSRLAPESIRSLPVAHESR